MWSGSKNWRDERGADNEAAGIEVESDENKNVAL